MGSVSPSLRTRVAEVRRVAARTEDSVQLRVVVLAAVMVGIVAVLAQGVVDPATAVASLVLTPLGFWVSWRRRHERNVILKIALAVGLLLALGAFLNRVRYANSVDDARAALAALFLWVQIIHSYDLPRLRDLSFSMSAAVVLMAEAGALSLDTGFGLFLVVFGALAGVWLFLSQQSVAQRAAGPAQLRQPGRTPGTRRRFPVRMVAAIAALALLAGTVVFLATPRLPGGIVVAPPYSLRKAVGIQNFAGQIVNPGASAGGTSDSAPPTFSPDAYPGFGSAVDLRARGILSDEVVMKVRSPEGAFWRGQAYDTWDGTRWTASQTDLIDIDPEPDFRIPDVDGYEAASGPVRRLVQTFYVQTDQPNLAFGAYKPTNVYFPANKVVVDPYLSIRTPILLDEGVVYSVISDVPVTTARMLRDVPAAWPNDFLAQYTQLPPEQPARIGELAHRITDGLPTTYDKVLAIERWLQNNTLYNLNIPADPPGADAVDHFLFERRQGFCEHLASAMVVMLRSIGIPARFAVGFDEGERNPLTGYFEVKESDAHAWVEVYYPTIGWVEYDPTHGTPVAEGGLSASFIAPEVFKAVGSFLSSITPEPVKQAFGAVARGIGSLARGLVSIWPAVLVALAALGVAAWAWARRAARRRRPDLTGAAAAFASVCDSFGARGHPRPPQRTPAEHLASLLRDDELARTMHDDLAFVVETFERERFASDVPGEEQIRGAAAAAARIGERAAART